jgi:hypothetical protein
VALLGLEKKKDLSGLDRSIFERTCNLAAAMHLVLGARAHSCSYEG